MAGRSNAGGVRLGRCGGDHYRHQHSPANDPQTDHRQLGRHAGGQSAAKKPDAAGVAYQATKAGTVGLAHGTMEEERKHGIRTTVIFPGLTDTALVEKRRTPTPPDVLAWSLQPEDVAAACVFVQRLPPRAYVPELLLYPSQL
jgi:NAD(P)-dependent dehydrogenase (short-subunit alcohol dehydrogenase family)